MKFLLYFDDPTRFKHQYTLDELSEMVGAMRSVEEIHCDLESIYMSLCPILRSLVTLLRDRSVNVEFDEADITKLRMIQKGFSEMMADFVFNLEMRAKPNGAR